MTGEQWVRLIEISPEDEQPTVAPNEEVFAKLREIATMKARMQPTGGEETDRLLQEARAGGMENDHPGDKNH